MYCVAFSAVSQKRVCIVTVPCCMRTRFIACCKFAWLPVSVSVGSSCKRSKDLCVLSKYSFKAFCLNFVEAGSLSTWFLLRRTTMEASAVVGCFRVPESPTPSYITCQYSRITIEYLILRVRLPTHRWYLRPGYHGTIGTYGRYRRYHGTYGKELHLQILPTVPTVVPYGSVLCSR